MNKKKELIKKINELSGSRSPYEVYCDWVKCMALALQNSCCMFQDETWAKREEEYIKTIRVYGEDGKCIILKRTKVQKENGKTG